MGDGDPFATDFSVSSSELGFHDTYRSGTGAVRGLEGSYGLRMQRLLFPYQQPLSEGRFTCEERMRLPKGCVLGGPRGPNRRFLRTGRKTGDADSQQSNTQL